MAQPSVGTEEDGFRFIGGDPSSQQSWEPVGPKVGHVEDGFRFKGGDPSDQTSWEAYKPPEPRGALRAIGDTALQVGRGAVTGVRMMTDIAGADNPVSGGLRSAEDAIGELLSASAKKDQQRIAEIMQEAEGKGWAEQIGIGLRAAGVAPGALIAQAAGTAIPTIAAGLLTGGTGPAAAIASRVLPGVVGAVQGAGNIKGAIYEETKRRLLAENTPQEEAEAKAVQAQSYAESGGQIALGGVLGAAAGSTGMEKAVSALRGGTTAVPRGIIGRVVGTGAAEAVPEIFQGGQEKYATNVALQQQGFDVDPMSGVVASGTMEGAAGFGAGAVAGIPKPHVQESPPNPDPIAPILQAKTVDEAIQIAATAVDTPASMTDRATLMTPPANGLITAARGREADAADLGGGEQLGRLPEQQVARAQAANETDFPPSMQSGMQDIKAQLAAQRAATQQEPNVSPSPEIRPLVAGPSAGGMPVTPPSLDDGVGAVDVAQRPLDAGGPANQPNNPPVLPGAAKPDALKPIKPQETKLAQATQAVQTKAQGQEAPAAPVAQGIPQGIPRSARQVAIDAEKARIEAKRTERRAAAQEASKPMEGLSVGSMPTNAEPVTVKNGVVHIGKYPAQNFETGEDIKVPAGASPAQIAAALKESGALGKKARVFGLQQAPVTPAHGESVRSPEADHQAAKEDVARRRAEQQPWQITREEYVSQQPTAYREAVSNGHRVSVARAIEKGEAVPQRVLADYPDLQKKKTAPGAAPGSAAQRTEQAQEGLTAQPPDKPKTTTPSPKGVSAPAIESIPRNFLKRIQVDMPILENDGSVTMEKRSAKAALSSLGRQQKAYEALRACLG